MRMNKGRRLNSLESKSPQLSNGEIILNYELTYLTVLSFSRKNGALPGNEETIRKNLRLSNPFCKNLDKNSP